MELFSMFRCLMGGIAGAMFSRVLNDTNKETRQKKMMFALGLFLGGFGSIIMERLAN